MKITDPGIIKDGEKDLIDAIKDDLDLDSINEIIKDKLKIKNLEPKGGKIIVHNNEVAFQIEFELSLNGSLMFDRDGNYIPEDNSVDVVEKSEIQEDEEKGENEGKNEAKDKDEDEIEADAEMEKDADEEEDNEAEDNEAEDNEVKDDEVKDDEAEEDIENTASELKTEDDSVEDDLSEIDLDIEGFEEDDDTDIDFSDDEDIGDILKESRDFWDNKKKE